ncbi:MAG: UvrD-helicase domain-containing protein [Verrucomicrobia bacterium]|nr:UvrD-helicase domain-containing protein [Verrucomicrobiota bacterium]
MNAAIEFTTASAGSGKTFRLVEIAAKAIEDGSARPQGIVATTFTVAAANELRERLAAKFYEAGRYQDAVLLGSGMIGTVHGICLELLSRFSLEAGLSPEVTILDDTQSQILLSRAFDTILSGDEENELYQLSTRLAQIDPRTNTHHFRTAIPKIVADARGNDIDPLALPAMGAASWEEMKAALPAPTSEDLNAALAAAIKGALQEIDPGSTVGVVQTYRQILLDSARSLKDGKLGWADWNKLSTASPGSSKANAHIATPVQEIASRLGEHPRFHEDHEAYLALLFKTASHLANRFGQLKHESGAADFADLEKEALDLLTHSEEVRSILTEEIDLLVVDEFQDTSPIQLALFSRLAECAKRVVWVGDVKQAIYGFRGADPELIISAVAGAEKAGTLGKSWRSTPDLVHLVNELFAKPFEEHLNLPREDVTLTPHRQTHPGAFPSIRIAKVTSGEIKRDGEPKRLKNEHRHSATADAIQAFLTSGEQVIDKPSVTLANPTGTLRPVTPRDIAVLVRTGDHAKAIASELRARGIDVSLSTPGLLATPECQLALACLRVLVDPRDSLASAEVIALEALHPPETWLSDRLIYLQKRAALAIGETLPDWGINGAIASPSIKSLLSAREQHHLTTLSPLALYDLAHSAADVPRLTSAWGPSQQRAEQRIANLSRLREFIQEYQDTAHSTGAPVTLNGLFGWLTDLADDYGTNEALDKGPIDPEIDAVHIGTYHGAKGLEWPVVFAADLDTDTRTRLFSLRPHSDAEKLDLANPLVGRGLRLWIHPFGKSNAALLDDLHASPIGLRAQSTAISEDLRLLYVGLTRARDTLVLVHDPATVPSWLNIANAQDLLTTETTLTLRETTIPCAVTNHIYEPLLTTPAVNRSIQVPVRKLTRTQRPPLIITPSSREPIPGATIAETVEFGHALNIPANINARDYGDAMHRIIAVEIQNPNHPARRDRAARLLAHWELEKHLIPAQVLATIDTYLKWIEEKFSPTRQLIEVPFTHTTADGQQATGFIDHLILTPTGPVILDHKIFPGPKATWEKNALSYSGQLHLYQQVVSAANPDQPSPECWIHLVSSGAAVRVTSDSNPSNLVPAP